MTYKSELLTDVSIPHGKSTQVYPTFGVALFPFNIFDERR